MSELLGSLVVGLVKGIFEIIVYIVMEIIGHMFVGPVIEYFLGRTGWFSILYIVLAGAAAVLVYQQTAPESYAIPLALGAALLVMTLAPLLHVRLAALIRGPVDAPPPHEQEP